MGRRVGYSYYIFCSTVCREQAVKFCIMILLVELVIFWVEESKIELTDLGA